MVHLHLGLSKSGLPQLYLVPCPPSLPLPVAPGGGTGFQLGHILDLLSVGPGKHRKGQRPVTRAGQCQPRFRSIERLVDPHPFEAPLVWNIFSSSFH